MGLRLPWTWRLEPLNASERADVMNMVEEGDFPENTLFCGDAGFVGYPLWSVIRNKGHHFLVRVVNVNLLTERGDCILKKNMLVLSWPQDAINACGFAETETGESANRQDMDVAADERSGQRQTEHQSDS